MEQGQSSGSDKARLDMLEGGQREIIAAITNIKATLNQLSMATDETRRMVQRGGERRSHRSSASRYARPRAEERYDSQDFGSRGLRHDEEQQGAGRRRGGRVEGRGVEVERWLEETDHSRAYDR